jgi:hypothetical protein
MLWGGCRLGLPTKLLGPSGCRRKHQSYMARLKKDAPYLATRPCWLCWTGISTCR